MRNVESSMDWMSFSNKMKQVACQLSSSACPMVLVLPDGKEIRFTDIEVGMFNYKGKRGDTEYTSIGFKVNLLGAEVINVQDDGSLANSPYGNGAKMREALEYIKQWSEDCISEEGADNVDDMIAVVDDALAEPPRNCDRLPNRAAAIEAYQKETGLNKHPAVLWTAAQIYAFIDWLFATKKGENDAIK